VNILLIGQSILVRKENQTETNKSAQTFEYNIDNNILRNPQPIDFFNMYMWGSDW
jgi:hypothetical protein